MEFYFDKMPELEGSTLTHFEDIHGDATEWLTTWKFDDGSVKELHWMGEDAAIAFCIAQVGEESLSTIRSTQ